MTLHCHFVLLKIFHSSLSFKAASEDDLEDWLIFLIILHVVLSFYLFLMRSKDLNVATFSILLNLFDDIFIVFENI